MKLLSTTGLGLATAMAAGLVSSANAETELTMYYPIAVGGSLTEVVDGIVADFEAENPDINVTAIYSGNYDDTRVRALSALASGESAQLAVMFSIDAYDLIEQELIVPFEEVATTDADKTFWDKRQLVKKITFSQEEYAEKYGKDRSIQSDSIKRKERIKNIDIELEVESLTPIQPIGTRLAAWKEVSGKDIRFENFSILPNT